MNERNAVLEDYYLANKRKLIQKVSGRAATPENAEDIVHNAFVNAMTYWHSFDPTIKPIEVWFGNILSNALKRFMKDDRNYGTTDEFDEELHEGVNMTHSDDDLLDKIRDEFKHKNKLNKEVLSLYFINHYTPMDIMQIMDIPYKTVESCLSRFKAEIRLKYGAVL